MTDYIRIQQIRSPIRRHYSQRRTLQGLGLNKIGRTVSVRFDGPMWGMIQKVRHLIRFPDQELFEEHRLVLPRPKDEAADEALVRQLVLNGQDVEVERLPGDDWIFAIPKDLKPGEIRKESREDPTAHALARVIGKAAAQFDAVNPDHVQPNILVIVSHARLRGPTDLHLAIGGNAHAR